MSRCLKIYLKAQILNKKKNLQKNLSKKKVNFTKIQKKSKARKKRALLINFLRKLRFDFGNPRVNARLSLVFLVVIVKRKPDKLVV